MFDATKRSDWIDDGSINSLKRLCTIDSWNNQDLTTISMEDVQAIVLGVPQTIDEFCIMADWILVGVIMGWHSIKRTVEGVVLVKLLSSLMLHICVKLLVFFLQVHDFLEVLCELGYGGRSLWNSYCYRRQSSRNISSNSSCTKSCRKWRDLTVHNIFLRTHQFLHAFSRETRNV